MEDQNKNPIMFAQVREDPNIEQYLLKRLEDKSSVLLVGSGGCTLFSILGQNVKKIDVVDLNGEQINLIKLKLEVMEKCLPEKVRDLFSGSCDVNGELDKLDLTKASRAYCQKYASVLEKGLTQCGTFEELFRELVRSDFDFETVFARDKLIDMFGEAAVTNSNLRPFSDHFRGVWEKYSQLEPQQNRFYHQILKDSYHHSDLPSYLSNLENINRFKDRANFICTNFCDFVKNTKNSYDMIQTSNLTDWMDSGEIDQFIQNLYMKLNWGGYVVLRRLNGDYQLGEIVGRYFKIVDSIPDETSCFYTETVVGYKLKC